MSTAYLRSKISGFIFDVSFKEEYSFSNQITQHPVQSGANINDHVYRQPVKITFDLGVSDCLASVVSGTFSSYSSRSASAFIVLEEWWNQATVLDVSCNISGCVLPFYNMIISELSITKDKNTHHAIRANVTLQQVVVTNAVSVGVSLQSSDTQTTNETISGNKTMSPVDENSDLYKKTIEAEQSGG